VSPAPAVDEDELAVRARLQPSQASSHSDGLSGALCHIEFDCARVWLKTYEMLLSDDSVRVRPRAADAAQSGLRAVQLELNTAVYDKERLPAFWSLFICHLFLGERQAAACDALQSSTDKLGLTRRRALLTGYLACPHTITIMLAASVLLR
jgi:hypothetical protein